MTIDKDALAKAREAYEAQAQKLAAAELKAHQTQQQAQALQDTSK